MSKRKSHDPETDDAKDPPSRHVKKAKSEREAPEDSVTERLERMLNAFLQSEKELKSYLKPSWSASIRDKHAGIACDPENNRMIEVKQGAKGKEEAPQEKRLTELPFLPLEVRSDNDSPATPLKDILIEKLKQKNLVIEKGGEVKVLCPGDLKFVGVEYTQRDHLQPKRELVKEHLPALIEKVGSGGIQDLMEKHKEYKPLFILAQFSEEGEEKYYGTKLLYELAVTHLDNLWLMCCVCNHSKSDQEVIGWFRNQDQFSEKFLEQLSKGGIVADNEIKKPDQLADAALEWLVEAHSKYIDLLKKITQDIAMELTSALREAQETTPPKRQKQKMQEVQREVAVQAALASSESRQVLTEEFKKHPQNIQKKALEQVEKDEGELASVVGRSLLEEAEKRKKQSSRAIAIQEDYEEKIHQPFQKNQEILSRLEAEEGSENEKAIQIASTLEIQSELGKKIFSKENFEKLKQLPSHELLGLKKDLPEKLQKWLESEIQAGSSQKSRLEKGWSLS